MILLEALNFVNRATADKDIVQVLTHICVHEGKLQGADARMSIQADCPELSTYSFTVPAEKFIKAVTLCNGTVAIEKTDSSIKLSNKRFKVTLPCLNVADFPRTEFKPDDAVKIEAPAGFVEALKKLFPFISTDATRPWSLGVWLSKEHFYATNNVTLARVPVNWSGPSINLPRYIVEHLLEIKEPIIAIWASKNSVSFQFPDGWLRAQLYTDGWPEVDKMFDKPQEYELVPDGLASAVDQLLPFCADEKFPTIHFKDNCITTAKGIQSAELGFDWSGLGVYRAEVLQLILSVAVEWSPSSYPGPIFFRGDGINGLFVGVRS